MLFQLLFGFGRSQTYTVHEGPNPPTDRMDRADALRFIKDGFSLQAAILAPFWLAARQLWAGLAVYLCAVAVVLLANAFLGLPDAATLPLLIAIHALVGFEADTIERETLDTQGWQSIGSVNGTSALDCERRFLETWLTQQPVFTAKTPAPAPVPPKPPRAVPAATAAALTGDRTVAGRFAALIRRGR